MKRCVRSSGETVISSTTTNRARLQLRNWWRDRNFLFLPIDHDRIELIRSKWDETSIEEVIIRGTCDYHWDNCVWRWKWLMKMKFVWFVRRGYILRWLKNGCSAHGMECLLEAIQITLWYWWETFSPHGIVMIVLCDTDYVADVPW